MKITILLMVDLSQSDGQLQRLLNIVNTPLPVTSGALELYSMRFGR